MQSKFNQLVNKSFVYQNKTHKVLEVKDIYGKIAIITDKQAFSKLESDFDDFMEEIDVREMSVFEEKAVAKQQPKGHVYQAEIIKANNLSARITDKLEAVFDELANKPSEETFKKANAMVSASNAIVNVQMANYKFLTLK